ncbi:S9 family peptidase [Acidicapsa dinghuensis]|uniref:S9 family peptidase n=1 Tax=Acidicapsa dinghuensis TaxID=2218256 RepID=A0ABW1EH10_9BACT|nr:prolyl oligopeptidase family serine peptidase [Acidicapsa dinghuensis]
MKRIAGSSLCSRLVFAFLIIAALHSIPSKAQVNLPPITLDEYLNTTDITGARISPDGSAAVIGTESPDWKNNNFRHALWLWTTRDGLRPLTQSGSDDDAQWSPDGKWIAFLSDRSLSGGDGRDDGSEGSGDAGPRSATGQRDAHSDDKTTRIWLISPAGGEAQPLFRENLDVHAFAWSSDGKTIYFSVTAPLTHEQEETKKEEWKDVIRWREQERGDLLLSLPVAISLANASALSPAHVSGESSKTGQSKKDEPRLPQGAQTLSTTRLAIQEIAPSPDGANVAFLTQSVSHRMEDPADIEIFEVPTNGGATRQITHNQALEAGLKWSSDSQSIYFVVHAAGGSLEGSYRDVEGRLYRLNLTDGKIERLGADFTGSLEDFELLPSGQLIALGLKGTEQQIYQIDGAKTTKLPGIAGSYAGFSAPKNGTALLVRQSSINHPGQVYLATDALHPDQATQLTHFNPIFAQRAQPEWRTYTWKSKDGTPAEGVLIFPPGQKDAKHLRMLTFIHGGPADADGNRFGADWYDWATLAASHGWLVFRPNYRGSSGYGDDFMLQIAPHLVSKPGEDILAGVDALVKDGYADPDKLAIGGYSYGGYMTNWLITETTRFKAAVTGAGAVEHAANWGNDDVTWDDAWYLNGKPWETPELYQSEAALFRMNRVKTPTHIVQGNADVRVSYLEGVTLERALEQLGIPHSFLVFPGEGHSLANNPWHGYIKLREELKWLDKYDPQ